MSAFDDPDLRACAAIVQKGDPDRFAATMAAPVPARVALFPLYAFNVEIARAPFASKEPIIAEMRLQWWADALDEIAAGGMVRRHEVTVPLAQALDPGTARLLQRSVDARRRDAQRLRPETAGDLQDYLDRTGGTLMWAAVRVLDATVQALPAEHGFDEATAADGLPAKRRARAEAVGGLSALANYLLAVPEFLARGINPLPEMSVSEMNGLIDTALARADAAEAACRAGRPDRIAELAAWRARGVLRRARADHAAIPEGRLDEGEFRRRLGLTWRGLRV
ncbi:squalene/phytoene synthase family protein [Cognatishimia sp. F0-27]|uniref:squalene/phytoene synthase family protein n=1 Tax=Cognatishimia sp. F0-27 TaxID=2816855 RepID=UPI001D0CA95F|nr:squalene/phytoene synthase family protein [Cognatishimia sp. F0-27]MCC1491623.1 squalene/phytoene synthase family protein [Cognatishimia sp. F0-27]